jgi:hypothetical protein
VEAAAAAAVEAAAVVEAAAAPLSQASWAAGRRAETQSPRGSESEAAWRSR